jgi:ribonuclease Z
MSRSPFRCIEPTFFAGLFDDPLLLVRIRPLGESILFDCGQIHHLAKRVVKSISALFITHAHMDHFIGFDSFVRHNHVSPGTFYLFGPPGIATKIAARLSGYDWNLTEPDWCTFRVHEVHGERVVTTLFLGREGFPCLPAGEEPRRDNTIYRSRYLDVKGELCDHRIPSLIFRVTENPPFRIDQCKMAKMGLVAGDWLRKLEKGFYGGFAENSPLDLLVCDGEGVAEKRVKEQKTLYEAIRREEETASIGYVADIGATAENMERIVSLMAGVTLLVCECTFLEKDRHKARESFHLATSDLIRLVDRIRPKYLLPMHLSKSYSGKRRLLYDELQMPPDVTLLEIPDHITPCPLLTHEIQRLPFTG